MKTYFKLLTLLTPRERRRFYLLNVLILIMGVIEVSGVASVMPVLGVLSNPGYVDSSPILSRVQALAGLNQEQFLVAIGLASFCLIFFGTLFKLTVLYALIRFSNMRSYSISRRLLQSYLGQDYEWFVHRNSAEGARNLLSEVDMTVQQALVPAMKVLSFTTIALFLVILLFIVDPNMALIISVGAVGSFGGIYVLSGRMVSRAGRLRARANKDRFRVIQETFGGIKHLKLRGLERDALGRFEEPARSVARAITTSQIISELPRYLLEAVFFGGMLLLVVWEVVERGRLVQDMIPVFGLFAFAGAKLFPALQNAYRSFSTIRFALPALDALCADLEAVSAQPAPQIPHRDVAPVRLRKALELDAVTFTYRGAGAGSLNDLSLTLPANTTLGVVGSSGAGKTTLIDVLAGLLQPQAGTIRADGVPLTRDNLIGWQRNVGYVPQDIFLLDDTIAGNIAYGVPPEEVDRAKVEAAARAAQLHDFVLAHLPEGYDTGIGERGVRLSGGQRQRIGIARALYHQPDVLIFDEATSALDTLTEQEVMKAIYALSGQKTIILVAHRLSTVRAADSILMLEGGRVAAHGPFDTLVEESAEFRKLVHADTAGRATRAAE